jgi:hypothetical protein
MPGFFGPAAAKRPGGSCIYAEGLGRRPGWRAACELQGTPVGSDVEDVAVAAWVRMVLVMTLMVLPGGFFVLFGWVLTRSVLAGWKRSQAAHAGRARLGEVVAALHFRELVAQARHAL